MVGRGRVWLGWLGFDLVAAADSIKDALSEQLRAEYGGIIDPAPPFVEQSMLHQVERIIVPAATRDWRCHGRFWSFDHEENKLRTY